MRLHRTPRVAVLVLLALLAALLAPAPGAVAAESGRVRGAVIQAGPATPQVKVLLFTQDWTYLGVRRVSGGAYSLALRPGRYHLQFVDQRPVYDVHRSRPTDVSVTVRAGRTSVANVRMRRGGAIGGTVRAGGKVAPGARVVAASADERSFETTADRGGNFALGGLPAGRYSIFTYDRSGEWVAKSTYLPRVAGGSYRNLSIRLNRRAGTLLVDLYTGRTSYGGIAFVTAVSRVTGQFWTARATRGTVTFRGLHPGRYDLQVPGTGVWLSTRASLRSVVRSGRPAFGSVRLTRRGAWVSGVVVDSSIGALPVRGASVRLVDRDGTVLDTTTSGQGGRYVLDGPILTQSGLSVVAGPGPDSPYLGEEPTRCAFDRARVSGISVRTGHETGVGSIVLPYVPGQQRLACQTPTPDPTPTPIPVS